MKAINFIKIKHRVRRSVYPTNRVKRGIRQVLFPYRSHRLPNLINLSTPTPVYVPTFIFGGLSILLGLIADLLAINRKHLEEIMYRVRRLEMNLT